EIAKILGIRTESSNSTDYTLMSGKNEKIISIVKQLGGTHYLTGPSAQAYIKPELFKKNSIEIEFMDYSHYPIYDQPWGKFSHNVSILDMLFCTGSKAHKYIWG
ncbi:MAG: WbqC family protein, partial [Candidatus Cloacimonetes bacterium]|nr:WbqC family protein [Candidatus Cloacimonadota bacterium]